MTQPAIVYQPYFVAYAKSLGVSCDEATGLPNHEFMRWIQAKWAAYFRALGVVNRDDERWNPAEHEGRFRAWLEAAWAKT